jgi:glycosyltransferase involved in cell wall biosynthesis
MNRQQVLSRLAKRGWPVIYSNGPLSVWDRGSAAWRAAPLFSTFKSQDGVQVEVAGKMLPRWPRLGLYDRLVTRHYTTSLLRHARCAPSDAIAHIYFPSFEDIAAAMNCRWTVYYAYDLFAQQPGWSDALAAREESLVRTADLVVASSQTVADALREMGRKDVVALPNAADSGAFEAGPRQPCPPDLAGIPRPRIGYTGNLNRKVDFGAIAAVAAARPDWHWVLVGPVATGGSGAPESDPENGVGFRQCRALPNVHFLGPKPHGELPAYTGHVDVNTICYRMDTGWWNAASPLKLHEYLATGLPVVSVDLPGLREFGDIVHRVSRPEGWLEALEAALGDVAPAAAERRRRVARANSWDMRVDQYEALLLAMIGGNRDEAKSRGAGG